MSGEAFQLRIVAAAALLGAAGSVTIPAFEASNWDLTESQCVDIAFDSRDHSNSWMDLHRNTRHFKISFRKGVDWSNTCVDGGFNVTVNSMEFETPSDDPDTCRKGRVFIRGGAGETLLKHCPTEAADLTWVPDPATLETSSSTRRLILQFRFPEPSQGNDHYVVFNGQVCSTCAEDVPVEERVLVIVGGDTTTEGATDNVELINMDTGIACTGVGSFPHGLRESTSAMLGSTPVVAGGKNSDNNRIDEYVTLTSSGWSSVSDAFGGVFSAASAVKLTDTTVLVSGGIGASGESKTTRVMDISSGPVVVSAGPTLLEQKMSFHCSAMYDVTKVMIGGGQGNKGDHHFEYTVATNVITEITPDSGLDLRNKGVCGVAALSNGQKVYIAAGGIQSKVSKTSCDRYNPTTDTWDSCAALPVALHAAASVPYGDTFLVVGGATSTGGNAEIPNDQIYMYVAEGAPGDYWSLFGATLAEARAYHTAFITTKTLAGC